MYVRNLAFVAMAALAVATPARAALVLEYIQLPSAGPASGNINSTVDQTGPALTSLSFNASGVVQNIFLQVCLRDTLGAGIDFAQPSTVPWVSTAGPGSSGLGAFFLRFDGYLPGVLFNPAPTIPTNINLVHGSQYLPASAGSNPTGTPPPPFTIYGGLVNTGFEPGLTPTDGTGPGGARIGLFNIRLQIPANSVGGSGTLRLKDPNPTPSSDDNALLVNGDAGGTPNPGTFQSIDALLFGAGFTGTFDLPFNVVGVPEPSSMVLCGLAVVGMGYRKLRRKTVTVTV